MHKPAQVELQLDQPQLPYSEIIGPIIAGGSPTHYRRRQSNPTKKGPYIKLATSLGSWEADRGKGKEKKTEPLVNNATKVQDDTEYECHTLASRIQANNASPTAT